MKQQAIRRQTDQSSISTNKHRKQLVGSLPVEERRLELAGCSTALLEAGEGVPVILLHGPGETALWWMRVIPELMKTHRVIVPDLPGHGETRMSGDNPDAQVVFPWLRELIEQTCPSPPVLTGHLLGGSIAIRFALKHQELLDRLVLVNSFGLGKFRPSPSFAFGLIRFMMRPTEKNYIRFLPKCIYDTDRLETKMGALWDPFVRYNVDCARNADHKTALGRMMKEVGIPKIPAEELEQLTLPVSLIWGRHDLVNKLGMAEEISRRYGWPLHVIDEARDDPKLERPEAVIHALKQVPETNPQATA